jgi:hypothetical protein
MDEDVQSTAGRRTGHCTTSYYCDGGSEGTGKLRSIAGGSASDPLSSRQHSAEEHTASEERSICMCMLSDRESLSTRRRLCSVTLQKCKGGREGKKGEPE